MMTAGESSCRGQPLNWYLIVLAIILVILLTGFCIAQQYQRGVVFRFGRLSASVAPA